MRTTTLKRPEEAAVLADWRRICHYYEGDEQISVCGTARRRPGEGHNEAECVERRHSECVVCAALL